MLCSQCKFLALAFCLLVTSLDISSSTAFAKPPVKIIFDTDFGDDGDDLAALCVLHHLADLGEVELLAVGQSNSRWDAPGAIDVINTYYGRPDIPIGIVKHKVHEGDQYSSFLVKNYKYDLDLKNVPSAVDVYRRALANAPDKSVKFVVIGFKSNMRDLLMSKPDRFSQLSGIELVKKKVILVSDMGGKYPSQTAKSSFNFKMVKGAAKYYVENWPTPMIFSGVGTGGIKVGMKVRKTKTPVGRAMELKLAKGWKPGEKYQAGFDLAAVLVAVRGADRYFNTKSGCNRVEANGANKFDYSHNCGHQHVDSKNRKVSYKKIGEMLEEMMLANPKKTGDAQLSSRKSKGSKALRKQATKIPVIFDSDIGDDIDDSWALCLLLRSPELDVKLVVGDQGKTEYRTKLFAKYLKIAKRTDIPIGVGLNRGEKGSGPLKNWIGDFQLKSYQGTIHKNGVQAIIDTIMNSPVPVTVIAVGPTPNILEALKREPKIATKARFVGMFGHIRKDSQGKIRAGWYKQVQAEHNVKSNIKASQAVFSAQWDITITPLDTCAMVYLKGDKYAAVRDSKDPLAKALIESYYIWGKDCQWFEEKYRRKIKQQSTTLFDTVAVYLAFSQDFCGMETLPIRVTNDGKTIIDKKAKWINVATEWKNLKRFEDLLVKRLIRK